MASVGSVRIGTRNIDIQASTGEVTSRDHMLLLSSTGGRHPIEVSGRAVFGVLALAALIVWRVRRRRKALMDAVTTALTTVRVEA